MLQLNLDKPADSKKLNLNLNLNLKPGRIRGEAVDRVATHLIVEW